jgi:hypothetical protein
MKFELIYCRFAFLKTLNLTRIAYLDLKLQ